MITYEDLFLIPYKEKGRDIKTGLDCYGLVLELCKRNHTPLIDITEIPPYTADKLPNITKQANVREIDNPKYGSIMQCYWGDRLHIGFMLDKKTVLHMTDRGPQVIPVIAFKNPKYYEVTPWQE